MIQAVREVAAWGKELKPDREIPSVKGGRGQDTACFPNMGTLAPRKECIRYPRCKVDPRVTDLTLNLQKLLFKAMYLLPDHSRNTRLDPDLTGCCSPPPSSFLSG